MPDLLVPCKIQYSDDEVWVDEQATAFIESTRTKEALKFELVISRSCDQTQVRLPFHEPITGTVLLPDNPTPEPGIELELVPGDTDDLIFMFKHLGLVFEATTTFAKLRGMVKNLISCDQDIEDDEESAEDQEFLGLNG